MLGNENAKGSQDHVIVLDQKKVRILYSVLCLKGLLFMHLAL